MKRKIDVLLVSPNDKSNSIYLISLFNCFKSKLNYFAILSRSKKKISDTSGINVTDNDSRIKFIPEQLFAIFLFAVILWKRPKIAHFQHEYAWYLGSILLLIFVIETKILRIRSIITMHSVMYEHPKELFVLENSNTIGKKMKMAYVKSVNRFIAIFSDSIIVHTEKSRSDLGRIKISKMKVKVIPHGVGINMPSETETRPCSKKKNIDELCIVTPGYIELRKGQDIAINILNELTNLRVPSHLHIIGEPVKNKNNTVLLRKLIQLSTGVPVYFDFNYLPIDELQDYIVRSDIVLLPYRHRVGNGPEQTNASGVLSLSLSVGKPVVCSDLPYFNEVLGHLRPNVIFNESIISEAVSIISNLYMNKKLLGFLSEQIRKIVSNDISWKAVSLLHEKLYNSILGYRPANGFLNE